MSASSSLSFTDPNHAKSQIIKPRKLKKDFNELVPDPKPKKEEQKTMIIGNYRLGKFFHLFTF